MEQMTFHPVTLRNSTDVWDGPPADPRFAPVLDLARRVFGVRAARVTFDMRSLTIDVALPDHAAYDTHLDESLYRMLGGTSETIVIPDTTLDARSRDLAVVTGDPGVRFYAGTPLRAPTGQRFGTLCLADSHPRDFGSDDRAVLQHIARWVEDLAAVGSELEAAQELQARLLPTGTLDLPGYDLAGACIMAQQVGGDLFDWQLLDGSLQLVVADVMGKGVAAAILGSAVRAVLRTSSRHTDLAGTVARASEAIREDMGDTTAFVTMLCAQVDLASGRVDFVDAGHNLGVIVRADGSYSRISSDSLPLGIVDSDDWPVQHDHLGSGDCLMVISDGVGDYFDRPDDAIIAAVRLCAERLSAAAMVATITEFAAGAEDDVTVVVLRRE